MSIFVILSGLAGLASLICLIIVVIKLFQEKGALHGILGILCGIYTFIWGWMNAARLNLKNVMIAWTIAIVVGIVANIAAGGAAVNAARLQQVTPGAPTEVR
jgi:hypothetical protein